MRTTQITVHNNQRFEIFTQRQGDGFEFWTVATIKARRMILDHHLTHDDLEAHLTYAQPGDLIWKNATPSEVPTEKHSSAVEMEGSIKRGVFVDLADQPNQLLAYHLTSMSLIPVDRKTWNFAKKVIHGQWADGFAKVVFDPDCKLKWSCPLDRPHPLNSGARTHGQKPDWWNFANWQLHLMNSEHKCGMRTGVLRVDEQEFHIFSDQPDRLAHILRRSE
jgi:hypothetical protein